MAFQSCDQWDESAFNVEITQIVEPIPPTDKLSDVIREVEDAGKDPRKFLLQLLSPAIREFTAGAVCRVVGMIRTAQKPPLVADQLAWASGLALMEGETIGRLAKKHGISKQAFQQGAEPLRRLLDIRSQSRRPEKMRAKMRASNYRRGGAVAA